MLIFVLLKKLIAIFLLLQISSNNSFAQELIRVPGLLKHFQHHKEEHHDVDGFLDFLHKHYWSHHAEVNDVVNHGGQEDHPDLPFKHKNCGLGLQHIFTGAVPAVETACVMQDLTLQYRTEDENISDLHVCHIWQPPKTA